MPDQPKSDYSSREQVTEVYEAWQNGKLLELLKKRQEEEEQGERLPIRHRPAIPPLPEKES